LSSNIGTRMTPPESPTRRSGAADVSSDPRERTTSSESSVRRSGTGYRRRPEADRQADFDDSDYQTTREQSTTQSTAAGRRSSARRALAEPAGSWSSGTWLTTRVVQYAVAAALVLALLDAGWQSFRFHRQLAVDDAALSVLVHSHFNHVSMTPLAIGAPAAKILYARDGSWVYVIADRLNGPLQIFGYGTVVVGGGKAGKSTPAGFGTSPNGSTNAHATGQGFGTNAIATTSPASAKTTATLAINLGTMSSDGRTATLMVRPKSRIRRIVLERGDAPVAEATLAY
jgi:hypothetical protein